MKLIYFKLPILTFIVFQIAHGSVERGQQLYSQICVNCHGPNLDGGIGPSLIDSYWKNGDSHDSIYRSIAKGITGTEMIAYELVYPEKDLKSLTDFIINKQEGNRETLRSTYPRDYFQRKRLHPDLFDSIESTSQKKLPENFYYVERMFDGILRGQSKLYISSPGKYRFTTGGRGRTSIWVNGDEVLYSNDKKDKSTRINKDFELSAGVHDLEIIHEEPTSHSMRFYARLQNLNGIEAKRNKLNNSALCANYKVNREQALNGDISILERIEIQNEKRKNQDLLSIAFRPSHTHGVDW